MSDRIGGVMAQNWMDQAKLLVTLDRVDLNVKTNNETVDQGRDI